MTDTAPALLQIEDLTVQVHTSRGVAEPVQQFSLALQRGETLGLIGESGSGKTLAMLAVMGLLPRNATAHGSIRLNGQELLGMDEPAWCRVRGSRIGMVIQEPMTALNPLMTLGDQVGEVLRVHRGMSRKDALTEAVSLFKRVRIPDAEMQINNYPFQISGGMRQRVMIAMALACSPSLLIADEPTTALDVTVQAQILSLLEELRAEFGTAILLITHDLGVVAQTSDRVIVMYAGQIVESAVVTDLFKEPLHPYTQGLLASIPRLVATDEKKKLTCIEGNVPEPDNQPQGCRFHPRCRFAKDICRAQMPALKEVSHGHSARCHLLKDKEDK